MSVLSVVARRASALLAVILGLTLPTAVLAQAYIPPAAPPIRQAIDPNGVDLTSGLLVAPAQGISIGGTGNFGLSFSRALISSNTFRDSTSGSVKFNGSIVTVNFGERTETFTVSGSNFTPNQKFGSTFETTSGGYLYTLSDGTAVTYSFYATRNMYAPDNGYAINNVKLPTGEVMTYNYKVIDTCFNIECASHVHAARLQSVTGTNGYMLKMTFSTNSVPESLDDSAGWFNLTNVTALNMAVDYCDPSGDSCTYSQTWPSLTFGSITGGKTFTDALGQVTTYTYTSNVLTGVKRPGAAANTKTISYASGKVSQVVNEGVTTNYTFSDASGIRTATISDSVTGNRVVKSDIANAQVTEDTDELGKKTSFSYDPTTRLLTTVTFSEGNSVGYLYDARGNAAKTTVKAKAGSGLADIVTEATFPPSDGTLAWKCAVGIGATRCNKPLTTKDARGNITQYVNDNIHGGLTKVTLPPPSGAVLCPSAGVVCPETRYSYASTYYAQYKNSGGTLVNFATPVTRLTRTGACQTAASCTDAVDEVKTDITYGTANALPIAVASGAGNGSLTATTAIAYDSVGNKQTVDGPLLGTADTTRYYYDALRRVIGVVGPDPDGAGVLKYRAQKFTYANNFLTLTEIGTANNQTDATMSSFATLQQLTSTYDGNARKTKDVLTAPTTASKYQIVKYSYDTRGMLECTAVRMNTANWDGSQGACSLEATGSNGPDRITRNLYDEVGRAKQTQTGYGTALQRNEVSYTYTDNGKVATVADAKNNLTTYEYDGLDRLTKSRYPSPTTPGTSSTTDYEQPTYDPNGNVTAMRLRDGQSIASTFDNLNRLTFKNLPGSEPDVTIGYDLLNRLTSANQTGNSLSFTYDALSRNLTQVGPLGTVTSAWDIGSRRTRLDLPGSYYTTYDYLVTGEMTAIRESGATSGPGVLALFTYDDLGRRTNLTRGNATATSYAFDAISRLASATQDLSGSAWDVTYCIGTISGSCTPSYNPASQILSRTVSNDAYAFTQQYNASRAYTTSGLNQYLTAGSATPSYDGRGNMSNAGSGLVIYSSENLMSSAPGATAMNYDPILRLYQITGAATTRFLYDGSDLVAEYDGSSALLRRYIHGPGTDETLVWYEGSGTTDRRWLHADERGSIVAVSNGSGAAIATNSYDEWGNPQTTNGGRFQYTGQTWLAEIGMYYYKARIYNARLGRFMQTDPIGYQGGMNVYAYAGSDPLNATDPTGLDACTTDPGNCPHGANGYDYAYTDGPDIEVTAHRDPMTFSFTAVNNLMEQLKQSSPGLGVETDEIIVRALKPTKKVTPQNGDDIIVTAIIPTPPSNLPGGPYTAKPPSPGNRPGSFLGPRQPKGPRPQAQWVPPEAEGGPPGSKGYWKTQLPGEQGWNRYTQSGQPLTPDQAHPNPDSTRSFFFLGPVGAFLCALFCESPAY